MTRDAEIMTGDPRWYNFRLGLSPLAYFFRGWRPAEQLAGMSSYEDLAIILWAIFKNLADVLSHGRATSIIDGTQLSGCYWSLIHPFGQKMRHVVCQGMTSAR